MVKMKEVYNRFGFLHKVINPKGTKANVYVASSFNPKTKKGVEVVRYDYPPYRTLRYFKGSLEVQARKLAREGHKQVTIRD